MNKPVIVAERVARAVIPDLNDKPLYIIQPRDDGLVTFDMIDNCAGMYSQNLDLVLKPELESRGAWYGRGVGVLVDAEAFFHPLSGFCEYEAERRVVGTVLHELVHFCDGPEREYIPEPAEAYDRFRAGCEARSQYEAKSKYPLALLQHTETWQRLACHVLHRASHVGGYCLSARCLVIGNTYSGLEFLPDPEEFIGALDDEVRELSHMPLRAVAQREQPTEFVKLWDRVLSSYISSPTLNLTNGENNHARSKKTNQNGTQLAAACDPRR